MVNMAESVFEYLNNKYIMNEQWKGTAFCFTSQIVI